MSRILVQVLAVVGLVGTVFAQDALDPANNINPYGFEFAQFLAERSPMEMTSIGDALAKPKDSVLVLLGDIPLSYQSRVFQFIDAGGAALVASDQDVNCDFVSTRSGPVFVRDPDARYQGHNDCFAVKPKPHELTTGIREIVFNRSGTFRRWTRRQNAKWSILASAPGRDVPVLGVYEQGTARLVMMADHSPFTNQMLTHGDNAILLVNTVNWLKDGRRRNVAFIVDGDKQSDSGLPPLLPEDEIPPIDPNDLPKDTMLAIANRFLREAQNDNAFNRLLASIPLWRVRQVLITLATVALGFFVFRRLTRSRPVVKPPETNASNASEARAATMLLRKTLYPAASELARGFVREVAGLQGIAVTPEINKRQVWVHPAVPGSVSRIQSDVAKIARLAGGLDRPKRFKPKQLRRLATRIDELTKLFHAGQLRLQTQTVTT
ncbi:MAG: hypothetical protein AB8G99_10745 [Planctomycetaceae bacterium]